MTNSLVTGTWKRTLTGGQTVAKAGGKVLAYYAKRPFLSESGKRRARERMSREGARSLFQGLSLLKGTALKMAQQLSLEMDMLPEAACRELARAYHQVPPINRALVRKVIQDGLGGPPEAFYSAFDLNAHAAASLGQVHRAESRTGQPLAVKIQYPGIAKTIDSDVTMLRRMLKPVIQNEHLMPTLAEVSARLREEVDYLQEAGHLAWFARSMKVDGVCIPQVIPELTSPTVLTAAFMPGRPLDLWLQTHPCQKDRDLVAQRLHAAFLEGVYELNALHADPNPGNFIIAGDLTVGLVDFGCVKKLQPGFVKQYGLMAKAASRRQDKQHFQQLVRLGLVPPDLPADINEEVEKISNAIGQWFGRLFAKEIFDFSANPDFISQGKILMSRFHHLQRHLKVNPDFIFLDRTRYGLTRLYEKMGARVRFRNKYEW